jgi:uncharacterized protein
MAGGAALATAVLVACGSSDLGDGERRPLPGFGETSFVVRARDGEQRDGCALLAETEAQRRQGLMERTDLGGYDAMVFRFPDETTAPFWMRDTPLPLSVAWFDGTGHFVSATAMAPCTDRDTCPLYHPAGPALIAVEVPRGRLRHLGIAEGSTLTLGHERCPG